MKEHFETWETSCLVCGEVITNPVCTECLANEIEDLLFSKNPNLIPHIKLLSRIVEPREENLTTCIFCGEKIDTCMFCFVQDILELLQNSCPELIDSFLEHFSYGAAYKEVPEEVPAM